MQVISMFFIVTVMYCLLQANLYITDSIHLAFPAWSLSEHHSDQINNDTEALLEVSDNFVQLSVCIQLTKLTFIMSHFTLFDNFENEILISIDDAFDTFAFTFDQIRGTLPPMVSTHCTFDQLLTRELLVKGLILIFCNPHCKTNHFRISRIFEFLIFIATIFLVHSISEA